MLNYLYEKRPIGWRSDGTGNPKHTHIWFPSSFPKIKNEHWKTAPISFESYWWISEWYRQGWDIDEIIDFTLSHHISTFNTKSFPIQYEWKEKIEYWLTKMGYRFVIREVEYPENVKAGETVQISLKIENVGVAPIYNKLPLKLRIKGEMTQEYVSEVDITKWLPDTYMEMIEIAFPANMPKGEYELSVAIGGGKYPVVRLATETEFDGEYHHLTTLEIQ